MAHESLQDSPLITSLRELATDVSDLLRKEIRLVKAEVTEALASGVKAGAWIAVAGFLALVAMLLVVQALVFAVASLGINLHWASLIVAAVLGGLAAGAFFYGRSLAQSLPTPTRTRRQIHADITAMREHLT
jgi:hypothetical protein